MTSGVFTLGSLVTVPASSRPDLVAPVVFAALSQAGLADEVGVVEIDAALSDTAATEEAYGLTPNALANCVIVAGKREGVERTAACVVLSTHRVDVNGTVKKRLDVRKASFMAREDAVELTGMEYGAITPIGVPEGWPVLVDAAVVDEAAIVVGSGIRSSKLLLKGADLARIDGVEIIEGLGRLVPAEA